MLKGLRDNLLRILGILLNSRVALRYKISFENIAYNNKIYRKKDFKNM